MNLDAMYNRNIQKLFKTGAIKVCPPGKPFWYTSGTIGPYYINTHFLYGSEEKAVGLLDFIDKTKEDIDRFHEEISARLWENYCSDSIYKDVMDQLLGLVRDKIGINNIFHISGGERRDWFFSFLLAELLDKPHLTIYKDFKVYEFYKGITTVPGTLEGKSVLHVADLLTEGSSYEKAWIQAIRKIGGFIRQSVVVVDRKQGGRKLLESHGIELY
ncbi:MAG: orotate phosphoribosyltransferase, partial [Clostridiaceae bacterium]|nr:orotate phosphoribosyltransferase [Clostridiaceae bacterium]